jgi:hypothetical protein
VSEPIVRVPYEHALAEINNTTENLRNIERLPDGRCRDLDGPTAIGVLSVRSNVAIASALLAVADALRGLAPNKEG